MCRLVTEVDALGPAEILPLFATLAVTTSLRIEWYQSAKGTPPSEADLKGTPVAAT
jgi:hypothetical protein